MKVKIILISLLLAVPILFHIQCGTEKREVLLRLKFNDNQSLRWKTNSKRHMETYANDSLVSIDNSSDTAESVEKVVQVIDSITAKLRFSTYFDRKIPDKKDSTKTVTVKDSSVIQYIQNNRGVTLDIIPQDTTSIDDLEYFRRLYEQLSPFYPDEPVFEGFKWNNNIKVMIQNGETKDATSTYTVKGFAKEAGYDCVIIEFKSNSIVPFQTEYPDKKGGVVIETRIDKRNGEGTTYIAYKEGFVVRESYSYDFLGEGTRETSRGEVKIKIVSRGSRSYYFLSATGI